MIEGSLLSAFSCCDFEYDHFEPVLDKDNYEYMFQDIIDQEASCQSQEKNRQSQTNEDERVQQSELIVQSKKKTIQKQKCNNHLKNNRKNKEQREKIRKIISHAEIYSVPHRNKGKKRQISINSPIDMKTNKDKLSAGCQNKNLMSFAIRPHLIYIQERKGSEFIRNHNFLAGLLLHPETPKEKVQRLAKLQSRSQRQNGSESMRQEQSNSKRKVPENLNVKDTATLEHFNVLYNDPNLTEVWNSFFEHKVLFRQLMISRVAPNYKFMFMNQLQRFQENFKRGSFKFLTSACQYDEEKSKIKIINNEIMK